MPYIPISCCGSWGLLIKSISHLASMLCHGLWGLQGRRGLIAEGAKVMSRIMYNRSSTFPSCRKVYKLVEADAMIRRKIEGHEDAVLCCHAIPGNLLVSGGEDAQLCYTDLNTLHSVGRLHQSYGEAVTSVCSSPAHEHLLYASAGQTVLALDLRKACKGALGVMVRVEARGQGARRESDKIVGLADEAICDTWAVNQDEINHIAVNRQGSWLAAADDSGEVQVINLQQPRGSCGRPTYKTLRRGHSNICSSACFRPHRPWELLSGGLDSTVVRWDFNRLRPQQSWNLSAEAAAAGGQVFNPPMVHSVVVPDTEDRNLCRLMAVARGDGCISLYDIDSKFSLASRLTHKDTSSSSSSSSSRKGTKSKGGKNKAGRGSDSGSRRSEETGVGSSEAKAGLKPGTNDTSGAAQSSAGDAPATEVASAGTPTTEAAADAAAYEVPFVPGRLCLLGREQGGHTAAVNCLAFVRGSSWQRLLSAGNDGRLVVWDWQAAAEEQGSSSWLRGGGAAAGAAGREKQRGKGAEGEEAAKPGRWCSSSSSMQREADTDEARVLPAAMRPKSAGQEAGRAQPVVMADVKHGRKINWVCSCEPVGGYNVFVADVTQRMTAMALF